MSDTDNDYRESKYLERYDRRSPEVKYKRIEDLLESNVENKHYPLFLVTSILVPLIAMGLVILALMIGK